MRRDLAVADYVCAGEDVLVGIENRHVLVAVIVDIGLRGNVDQGIAAGGKRKITIERFWNAGGLVQQPHVLSNLLA